MTKRWLTIGKRCLASIALLAIGIGGAAAGNSDDGGKGNGAATGAVFTMTNGDGSGVSGAGPNSVVAYKRAADGTLTMTGTFPTGGSSIGNFATGNQHGLLLSDNGRCLWAVNSMSNQVSSFKVKGTNLTRTNVIDSGGFRPVSVGVYGKLLYVLNAGGQVSPGFSDNVTGFVIGKDCGLSPLAASTRALSAPNVFPAQVSFDPTGSVVVVTEKTNNGGVKGGRIDTFIVGRDGRLGKLKSVVPPSNLAEPFGFAFDSQGKLLVTVADCHQPAPPGNLPGCSVPPDSPSLVSYNLRRDGTLTLIDALADNQAAKCWIVITNSQGAGSQGQDWDGQGWGGNGKSNLFAFCVNALATQSGGTPGMLPGGSVTGYRVSSNGGLTDIGVTPIPLTPVGVPVDAALSDNSKFLYVLSEGDGTITAFKIGSNGGLTMLNAYAVTPKPAIAQGGPFPNGLAAQ